jgi:hypothetical protein
VPDGGAHPPDEMVPPLEHRDLEPRLGRQPFAHTYAGDGGLAVVEADAAAQAPHGLRVEGAPDLGLVDPRNRT